MTDQVPEEAIRAAALVLADVEGDDTTYRDLADDVLWAAAPAIRAAERERTIALAEKADARYCGTCYLDGGPDATRRNEHWQSALFADLLRGETP